MDDAILEAATLGLLDAWDDAPGALAVCLSPLACVRLGIEIDATGERWQPLGTPPPPDRNYATCESDVSPDDGPGLFDLLPSPLPGPATLAAWAEADEATLATLAPVPTPATPCRPLSGVWRDWHDSLSYGIPRPIHLLGLDVQWHGGIEAVSPCPGCRGRTLKPLEACLCCLRSGVDRLLPTITPTIAAATLGRHAYRPDGTLKGGLA